MGVDITAKIGVFKEIKGFNDDIYDRVGEMYEEFEDEDLEFIVEPYSLKWAMIGKVFETSYDETILSVEDFSLEIINDIKQKIDKFVESDEYLKTLEYYDTDFKLIVYYT